MFGRKKKQTAHSAIAGEGRKPNLKKCTQVADKVLEEIVKNDDLTFYEIDIILSLIKAEAETAKQTFVAAHLVGKATEMAKQGSNPAECEDECGCSREPSGHMYG